MRVSPSTRTLLTYFLLKDVGVQSIRKILQIEGFASQPKEMIGRLVPKVRKALRDPLAWERAVEATAQQISEAERFDARILSPMDPDYPPLLLLTQDHPVLLWVQGRLPTVPEKSVAIIGTREPSTHGEIIAKRISQFFVDQGWSIISGLALGCDAVAHRAALEASGHTIAVLAHGLHTIAPARHRQLAMDILDKGGALISEFPLGQDARPSLFVTRDKTQAGISRGVVMIQSGLKGGSLHASRAALAYHRWLAVPYPTAKDQFKNEPKSMANLTLADGTIDEKLNLLHCTPEELGHLFILRGKDDYPALLTQSLNQEHLVAAKESQISLLL